jgi:DNA-binding SARP family transcriptional activator/tetratricopeptide (TPR) repeat protein
VTVRFALLGTLMLADSAGEAVAVSGARQRVLLATLLLSANVPVSSDVLAEAVWDGSPPPGAATTLRSHVRRLRGALGPEAGGRVRTCDPGYLISVQEPELDVLRFGTLCRNASAARRAVRWQEASSAAARALQLWRGAPLLDVSSQALRDQFVPGLEQMRLQALEDRIEADLRLGGHDRLVPELRELTSQHRMREQFHAQLMEALARAGRRAEALGAYRQARQVLVDELGIEPGPHLQLLHQQILEGAAALAAPSVGPGAAPLTGSASVPAAAVPRELPGTAAHFTGREPELAVLAALLEPGRAETPGTVVISSIGGTAGVGKTALAVHWAHGAADRFPDGQLYVNLRGYDPGQLVPAADALAGFLRALGLPGPDIPPDTDERAARYRSLLAGRRMLVVLDNAGSVEQVRLLLPGTPACVTVVTSRDSLPGLVARDGAVRLDLDVLPAADAVSLLRALIGPRADADPVATESLAAQCCYLPLALRVAAELAAARPAISLSGLAAELADQERRLDLLDAGGDSRTAVRAVFSLSYRHLDPAAARMFRLLGLQPGPDIDRYAAAALADVTVRQAERLLGLLARAHLIQRARPGRHAMHDLLRAYACDLAAASDTEDEQRAALTRLFDHYLHAASVAMDTVFPGERHRRPRIPQPDSVAPPVPDSATALAWLDAERATFVAVAVHASSRGWPGHAGRLATTLFRYLDSGGHYPEATAIHGQARDAARRAGDPAAEAAALISLGVIGLREARYSHAAAYLQQGRDLFGAIGDHSGEVRALGNLGILNLQLGRYGEATGDLRRALALFRELGDQAGEARALASLSMIDYQQGRYEDATGHIRRTLAIFRETGDRTGEAHALCSLGEVDLRQGDDGRAAGHFERALALFRETGSRSGEARALAGLGDASLRQGRYEQAAEKHQRSLAVCSEIGDLSGQASALNGLGEVLLASGQCSDARAQHAAALSVTSQSGEQYEQARAHNGLARACHAAGDSGLARRHWHEALTIYASLGAPETDQVRAHLATTDDDPAVSHNPTADRRRDCALPKEEEQ